MKQVKLLSTMPKHAVITLPGNIKVYGGEVQKAPEEVLENPGVIKYIESGRLIVVDEPDAKIPEEDLQKIRQAEGVETATVKKPRKKKEKTE